MKRISSRHYLAFCLLTLTVLLAASCTSNSDSSNSENTSSTSVRSTSETPQSAQPEPLENQNSQNENTDSFPVFTENTTPTNTATSITTGLWHSCALHGGGTISCWGRNNHGQLGNGESGDESEFSEPVKVEGIADATAITTGGEHSCALHRNGTISCWGKNYSGQLGNGQSGENAASSVPVQVVGITDATAVTTGWFFSCALHEGGTISCWGNNIYGQLGNGQSTFDWNDDSADSLVPVKVLGITNATAIASNTRHSCALHEDGTISCWGYSRHGQLGNGQNRDNEYNFHSPMPVEVAGIADATAVTTGQGYSCALHRGGTISCWGKNYSGQLGNGQSHDYANRSNANRHGPHSWAPTGVVGITDAIAISAGGEHSCTLHLTGAISCWGNNWYGQLGNGQGGDDAAGFDEIANDAYSPLPVGVVGITDATAITTGPDFSCALHQSGTISCWGNNRYGQLGNGQNGYIDYSSVPLEVVGIVDATAIATSWEHSCALHQGGTISCWGNNYNGQLGNGQSGENAMSSVPVQVADITDATAITTGANHSCALHQNGTISCWGRNNHGQLGNGESGDESEFSEPVKVEGIADATAITTGGEHSCALHITRTISCWGNNYSGQLGNGQSGENAASSVPAQVADITNATAITTGANHSCALHQNGTISCWGNNEFGKLGNGTDNNYSSVPAQIANIKDATAITTGAGNSCALHQTSTISCWGDNWYGQLGSGTDDSYSSVPAQIANIKDAIAIATGGAHSCALHQTGTISCWGPNWNGQLGNGQRGYNPSGLVEVRPVGVIGITDAKASETGYEHSCALHEDGTISCWGLNNHGQLGNGVWRPQPVVGFGG